MRNCGAAAANVGANAHDTATLHCLDAGLVPPPTNDIHGGACNGRKSATMAPKVLVPAPGVSPGIGFYLAGMEEVRDQLRETITGMTDEQISRRAVPEAHSIGALALHIGEAEWWWIQCNVSGHKLTDEDRSAPYWDVLKDPDGFAGEGYSAEF